MPKVLLLPIVIMTASLFASGQKVINKIGQGFEFRGLRTGVTESDLRVLLSRLITADPPHPPECFRDSDVKGKICSLQNYEAAVSESNAVWTVNYYFTDEGKETVGSFLLAFTAKYGRPTVSETDYLNGLGIRVAGTEYTWQRGTQQLSLAEMCGGGSQHCISILDAATAPRLPLPKI